MRLTFLERGVLTKNECSDHTWHWGMAWCWHLLTQFELFCFDFSSIFVNWCLILLIWWEDLRFFWQFVSIVLVKLIQKSWKKKRQKSLIAFFLLIFCGCSCLFYSENWQASRQVGNWGDNFFVRQFFQGCIMWGEARGTIYFDNNKKVHFWHW